MVQILSTAGRYFHTDISLRFSIRNKAMAIGHEAAHRLQEISGLLNAARNWGNWDLMSKNGVAAVIKHRNIDQARNFIHQVSRLLSRFEAELRDVYGPDNRINLNSKIGVSPALRIFF